MPRFRNDNITVHFDESDKLKIEIMNGSEYFEIDIMDAFTLSNLIKDVITAQIEYKQQFEELQGKFDGST